MIPDPKNVRASSVVVGRATTSAEQAAPDGAKAQTVEPEVRRPAPVARSVGTPLPGRSAEITESDFTRVAGVPRASGSARELTSALRDDHELAARLMRAS